MQKPTTKSVTREELFGMKTSQQSARHDFEWQEMKRETPEEKTFRNYKCIFCWRYLLRAGFSNFFGAENWRGLSADELFAKFDKLLGERQPDMLERLVAEMEEFFTKNPEEVWISQEILARYLPRKAGSPLIRGINDKFSRHYDIPHIPVKYSKVEKKEKTPLVNLLEGLRTT